ncbi:MAG: alpha-ketoacid dehydrogenase subunit beta [Dehalococcoidia bacterium]|nr:alpha-ketoacid dehydrogenase subunit beta [Dehalococcoidia bacterium]
MAEIALREALRQTLREELQSDERVIIMGEDIGAYGGSYGVTRGLQEEFGEERVRDTPISESAVVGCGIGAAMGGLRPVVELMTINFSFLAFDQIINNASKLFYMSGGQINVPLVIRMASGGGAQLSAQHSHDLAGWYAHVPGLKVVVPSTPYDARGLLKTALRDQNPVIFIEHTALYGLKGEVPEEEYSVPFGQAQVYRPGDDVTIIGYSGSVHQAARAAETLAERGVDAEVINLRTLRPLDIDAIIQSAKKTGRVIVVEDDWRFGGFAAEIAALIQEKAFDYLDAPVARVCGADVPMPYAKPLETAALPSEDEIVRVALAMV